MKITKTYQFKLHGLASGAIQTPIEDKDVKWIKFIDSEDRIVFWKVVDGCETIYNIHSAMGDKYFEGLLESTGEPVEIMIIGDGTNVTLTCQVAGSTDHFISGKEYAESLEVG